MKINDLNIIAQRLGAFGREHLGIDRQGHTVPTTSSLGGRIASWIRSRHSDTAAQANRDVMTGIINTIRQTDDLGDRFADIARKSLESKLAAGRPLSGREAARVLQDVIRIKTTEDQARLETRLINIRDQFQKLCAPHADGSPSDLETQTAARRQRFGLPPATAEQLRGYRDTVLRDLEARARRADHSLTAAESLDALSESIRMQTLQEAKAGIAAMAEQVSGEGPHGFMARLDAAMRIKGLVGGISPATRDVLVQTIHDKLSARCLYDSNNIHQPTLAEASTVADKVINNFVAALDTVEHARAMPREAKRILQDEILHQARERRHGAGHMRRRTGYGPVPAHPDAGRGHPRRTEEGLRCLCPDHARRHHTAGRHAASRHRGRAGSRSGPHPDGTRRMQDAGPRQSGAPEQGRT